MDEKLFVSLCKNEVLEYIKSKGDSDITLDDVYVVWLCKILQNNKALLSTNRLDGMYYEMTYNGRTREVYVDAYKKVENYTLVI